MDNTDKILYGIAGLSILGIAGYYLYQYINKNNVVKDISKTTVTNPVLKPITDKVNTAKSTQNSIQKAINTNTDSSSTSIYDAKTGNAVTESSKTAYNTKTGISTTSYNDKLTEYHGLPVIYPNQVINYNGITITFNPNNMFYTFYHNGQSYQVLNLAIAKSIINGFS